MASLRNERDFGIRVLKRNFGSLLDVAILCFVNDERHYVSKIETSEHEEDKAIREAFSINLNNAQKLMDELWNVGLRPSEGTGSAGAMTAINRHLEDMRNLVFHSKFGKEKNDKSE